MSHSTSEDREYLNWGILSTAEIGTESVIPSIQQSSNGRVLAIASRTSSRAEQVAKTLGIPRSYGSYEELLKSPEIDAVYVPLPNGLHSEWTVRAAEMGKHVLCEKSIAVTSEECEKMFASSRAHMVHLMEAFMYRFHPQISRLRAEISSGRIGEVLRVNSDFHYRSGDKNDIRFRKELGGGSLLDVGCYCVNAAMLVFGENPTRAKAWIKMDAENDVDEMVVGMLEFPRGKVLSFGCGFIAQPSNFLEVIGSKGTIKLRQAFRVGPQDTPETAIWIDAMGRRNPEVVKSPPTNHYKLMVEHFADCVLHDKELAYSPEQTLENMKALEMIFRAGEYYS